MSRSSVAWVLRADGVFNFLAGLVLLLFYRPVITFIDWPTTETPIYANVLDAALIGLSLAIWFAANHLKLSRDTILASIIAKGLAGIIILYWVLSRGLHYLRSGFCPQPLAYRYSSRSTKQLISTLISGMPRARRESRL